MYEITISKDLSKIYQSYVTVIEFQARLNYIYVLALRARNGDWQVLCFDKIVKIFWQDFW